jgi:hypothetical protein
VAARRRDPARGRLCTEPAHYANEIEPSSAGGERIVAAIMHAVTTHDFSSGRSTIYT